MTSWWVLWRLIGFQPWLYAANVVIWGVVIALPLATGFLSRELFNTLSSSSHATAGFWFLIALLVMTATARIIANTSGAALWALLVSTLGGLLRKNLLNRILHRPGASALADSPGEVVSRFRDDVEAVLELLDDAVDGTGRAAVVLVGLGVMVRVNAVITLVVFVPLGVAVGVIILLRRRIEVYRRASRMAAGRVMDFLGEIFGAVQAVKLATAEPSVSAHFARLNEARRMAALKDRVQSELLNVTLGNAVTISTGVILMLTATLMRAGGFTVGDFALFVFYLNLVVTDMVFFGNLPGKAKRTGVSVERLLKLLDDDPPQMLVAHGPVYMLGPLPQVALITKADMHRLAVLTVRGLTYRFSGTGRGVEGVDLTLRRGSFTVITGRVASGKTTLLRVLLGLLPKDGGEIRWNGELVERPAEFFVPPRCAYVPQVPAVSEVAIR